MWLIPFAINPYSGYVLVTRRVTVGDDGSTGDCRGGGPGWHLMRARLPGFAFQGHELPVTQPAPQPLCVPISSSSIRHHYYLFHIGLLRGFKQDNPFKEFITLPGTSKCAINVN